MPRRAVETGRQLALQALDTMLARAENVKSLMEALQTAFNENPVHFFRTIIMPLLPRQAVLSSGMGKKAILRVVLEGDGLPSEEHTEESAEGGPGSLGQPIDVTPRGSESEELASEDPHGIL